MAATIDKLKDTALRNAQPQKRAYKLTDGAGLYLLVKPNGGKYWRWKYRFGGKERLLAIGVYPEISLKAARTARNEARQTLANGIDPSEVKQARKAAQTEAHANSFEAVALEWYAKEHSQWSKTHADRVLRALEKDLFPQIGKRPASEISPPQLLQALRKVEKRGVIETAHRVKGIAGQVFRYAVATGRAERDISVDLKGALATPVSKHLAAITEPQAAAQLLLAIDNYWGSPTVKNALRLAPLVFTRPGELRAAKWADIDLEAAEWRYIVTKTNTPHIVPLSTQAIAILQEQFQFSGKLEYVFPGGRSPKRPLSDNALPFALRQMGIPKEVMSAHGFRAMARTMLDEILGYRPEWIEHQLAHSVKDPNGRAYNRTAHLEGRKAMMQGWADYLDDLKEQSAGGNVVAFKRS